MVAIPPSGVALIQQFEGLHLDAYPDPLSGAEPYTIGWGSTRRKDGTPFYLGEYITRAEADELLMWQIERDFLPALEVIPRWDSFTEPQAGAVLSFAYNLGAAFYGSSGFQTITRVLQDADWFNLEYAFTLYRNPGSNVEEGLLRRRLTESQVFLEGTPGVELSVAGQTYLTDAARTYSQNAQLSDQAIQYVAAVKGEPISVPAPAAKRVLYLTDPPLTGEDVRLIQEALIQAGAPLAVDGVFDADTRQAVEWFQRTNGLTVDGLVGEVTRSHLLQRSLYLTEPYMTGDDVATLQIALNRQGFDLDTDGVFGPGTQTAVETFQRQTGLLVDGVAGSHTRRILNARILYLTLPYFQGDDVAWLQKTLTRFGLNAAIDGVFGPGTEWAVKQFQARNYLEADGVVGPQTWVKLGW
ncbi:MAG: peptidoglycan-binding protein [Cyanobacteria bacterium P01_F01_bin.86]